MGIQHGRPTFNLLICRTGRIRSLSFSSNHKPSNCWRRDKDLILSFFLDWNLLRRRIARPFFRCDYCRYLHAFCRAKRTKLIYRSFVLARGGSFKADCDLSRSWWCCRCACFRLHPRGQLCQDIFVFFIRRGTDCRYGCNLIYVGQIIARTKLCTTFSTISLRQSVSSNISVTNVSIPLHEVSTIATFWEVI